MNGLNPCSVCDKDCYLGTECVFNEHSSEYQCCNYGCFLNVEGDCIISVFERCGAWKGAKE